MRLFFPQATRAVLAALLVVAATTARPAAASDLATARRRAQAVADRVSALERRLAANNAEQARLEARVLTATQGIAALEARMGATTRTLERTRDRYVERAVEAYKRGPAGPLALVLTADELNDLLDAAEAASRAAEADRDSLGTMQEALAAAQRAQEELDAHKQRLMAAEARVEAVEDRIEAILAERHAALAELSARIERLEEEARLRALRAVGTTGIGEAFAKLLESTGPSPGIPEGYVGTGVVFEGIASWYGPGFRGEATANGQVFDPDLYTAASRDLPFGTVLHVTYEGAGVVVVINDRGPYIRKRILDLSRAAAEAIGLGLGWVRAEVLLPKPR
jgi:peptidoglycan hydrolase CwlO-like protein